MALLAVGGWLFTAGGYERPSVAETRGLPAPARAAASQNVPASAIASQPVTPPAVIAAQPSAASVPASAATPALGPYVAPAAAALVAQPPRAAHSAPQLAPLPPKTVAVVAAKASPGVASTAPRRARPLPLTAARHSTPTANTVTPPPPAADEQATQADSASPVMKITMVGEAPAAAPEPQETLAEAPSRDDVVARLEGMRAAVLACAQGKTGVAELDITIASSGAITTVIVGGDFAGTNAGSCIARTLRQARFPRFQKERFRLLFPYSI